MSHVAHISRRARICGLFNLKGRLDRANYTPTGRKNTAIVAAQSSSVP